MIRLLFPWHIPWYIVLPTLFLLGPAFPFVLAAGFVAGLFVVASRNQLRRRSAAILGLLAMLAGQSFFTLLFAMLGGTLVAPRGPPPGQSDLHVYFSALFNLNLAASLVGVLAAVGMAVYVQFTSTRMDLSKAYPQANFLQVPEQLRVTLSRLCKVARVKPPEIALVDSGVPETFTLRARGKYWVAVSVGLLESFNDDEVEACLAHEVAHLKNRDFLMRFAATAAKFAAFAKPLSYLLEPAIYRASEFSADATAINITKKPHALLSVLSKLKESYSMVSSAPKPVPVCGFYGAKGRVWLLDKHPSFDSRIRRIEGLKPLADN